jgi:hypothetical protein
VNVASLRPSFICTFVCWLQILRLLRRSIWSSTHDSLSTRMVERWQRCRDEAFRSELHDCCWVLPRDLERQCRQPGATTAVFCRATSRASRVVVWAHYRRLFAGFFLFRKFRWLYVRQWLLGCTEQLHVDLGSGLVVTRRATV